MFGKLISSTIKVVTLPLDGLNAAQDIFYGGNGSKRARTDPLDLNPLGDLERLRDKIAEAAEDIDS